jgi:hypothetical protein
MSVMVSGRGPSSRRLPASTNGTLFLTHSYMMPAGACRFPPPRDAAGVVDGVDGAHVIAVAVLFLAAVGEPDAERGAEQGDSMSCTPSALPLSRASPSRCG